MPALKTIERFVRMVESNEGVEAISEFYAEHATMQENESPPRIGKEALLRFEIAAQASVTNLKANCIRPILVSESTVVIRWILEYTSGSGKAVRFEELAYQLWDGELIVQEKFFYDPAQFK